MNSGAVTGSGQALWRDPSLFRLGPGQVHVWSFGLDKAPDPQDLPRTLLSPAEWQRCSALAVSEQRRAFVGRRLVLRQILARYARCSPGEVAYDRGRQGKPVASGKSRGLGFSASSSGTRAIIAVADGAALGVDIEAVRWRPGLEAVALKYFLPSELARLAAYVPEARHQEFFRCWTRKEAAAKLSGEGLSALDRPEKLQEQGAIVPLPLGEGLVGHLAVAVRAPNVKVLHWAAPWEK